MAFSDEDYRLVAGHYDKMVPWDLAWASSMAIMIDRGGRLRVLGTGTLFQIADERFVITAAHVLEQNDGRSVLLPADGNQMIPLEGEGILDSTGTTDVAALRLLPQRADQIEPRRFLRLHHVCFDENVGDALFAVFGFPEMMSVHERTELKIIKYFHLANAWEGDPTSLEKYNKRFHFHISADLSETRGMDGAPVEFTYPSGHSAQFPRELKGISGGSVWKIADSPYDKHADSSHAKVVGVEHAIFQRPGCIRATKWKAVIGMLAAAMEDLRPAIDLWRPA